MPSIFLVGCLHSLPESPIMSCIQRFCDPYHTLFYHTGNYYRTFDVIIAMEVRGKRGSRSRWRDSDNRDEKAEVGGQRSEVRIQESGSRPEIRSRRSEVGSQESEVRDQKSGVYLLKLNFYSGLLYSIFRIQSSVFSLLTPVS